jgi:fumarate hydratase class II
LGSQHVNEPISTRCDVQVPAQHLLAAQTENAHENFPIGID